jgi:hypothetical protein
MREEVREFDPLYQPVGLVKTRQPDRSEQLRVKRAKKVVNRKGSGITRRAPRRIQHGLDLGEGVRDRDLLPTRSNPFIGRPCCDTWFLIGSIASWRSRLALIRSSILDDNVASLTGSSRRTWKPLDGQESSDDVSWTAPGPRWCR